MYPQKKNKLKNSFLTHTPIGRLKVSLCQNKVLSVLRSREKLQAPSSGLAKRVKNQLAKYFSKNCVKISCSLQLEGTPFQNKVWKEISKIKYGQTRTYAELAKKLKSSPRAVGTACGKNPCLILIPCHRVVAKNGLGGFALGLRAKKLLLDLEKSCY